jgi:glycosyltransferase involved in cell wall biosynthesis
LAWGYQGEIVIATTTVDAKLFQKQTVINEVDSNEDTLKILFLSRLIKDKGVYETIKAFENLRTDNFNIQLIIAGSGEESETIESLVEQNENISLTGHVEGQEKIELYKNCVLYCLPSYSEGLPTSVLEAMSFGKPVITTPVGGLKSFFQDGAMGYFVQPKDADDLEMKLRTLLKDQGLRQKIGEFNFDYAHQHIMSDKVAKKMFEEINMFL